MSYWWGYLGLHAQETASQVTLRKLFQGLGGGGAGGEELVYTEACHGGQVV